MERIEYNINGFLSLEVVLGKPYREGGFILARGCAAPQAGAGLGSGLCWQQQGQGWQGQSCAPRSPLLPFPAELQRQSTQLSANRKRDFFPASCIRKQSDLAVLVICLQLSWLRCTSQETNIFLINFPVTFYRGCKPHWSYPFSVHCGELWVYNRAQSVLCSQFQIFATEDPSLIIFI